MVMIKDDQHRDREDLEALANYIEEFRRDSTPPKAFPSVLYVGSPDAKEYTQFIVNRLDLDFDRITYKIAKAVANHGAVGKTDKYIYIMDFQNMQVDLKRRPPHERREDEEQDQSDDDPNLWTPPGFDESGE